MLVINKTNITKTKHKQAFFNIFKYFLIQTLKQALDKDYQSHSLFLMEASLEELPLAVAGLN